MTMALNITGFKISIVTEPLLESKTSVLTFLNIGVVKAVDDLTQACWTNFKHRGRVWLGKL